MIYDRAALVALPKEQRKKYSQKLYDICKQSNIFLLTYEYDQKTYYKGPPFDVSTQEIKALYGPDTNITLLSRKTQSQSLPNGANATIGVWWITPMT